MKSRAVQIARVFFYVLAALWLLVGIGYLGQSDGRPTFYVVAGLVFAGIPLFVLLGMHLTKQPVYWLSVATLILCIVLTVTDQFGLADLIALILFVIPLVIMLAKRNEFLTHQETP